MARPEQHFFDKSTSNPLEQHGFTLIELLVAVTIVGILSAIVYPSYGQYVSRASRAEVKGILLENAMFLERNYTLSNRYDLDSNGGAVALPYSQSPKNGTPKYTLAVAFPTIDTCTGGQCFTLSARPTGVMAQDLCGTFQLNHAGVQSNLGNDASWPSADCWQR